MPINNIDINSISPDIRDKLLNYNLILSDTITKNSLTDKAKGLGKPVIIDDGNNFVVQHPDIVIDGIYWNQEITKLNTYKTGDLTPIEINNIPNGNITNDSYLISNTLENPSSTKSINANDNLQNNINKNLYVSPTEQVKASIEHNVQPVKFSSSYTDLNKNIQFAGISMPAANIIGSVLTGKAIGINNNVGLDTSFDLRASLAGRLLGNTNDTPIGQAGARYLSLAMANNAAFNLQKKKVNGQETSEYDEDIQHYFTDDKFVFVKALIQFRLKNTNEEFYEYVPGYYEIAEVNGQRDIGVVEHNGVPYGYVRFQSVKFKDNGGEDKYSPITKAGLQFARMNLTKQVMQSTTEGGNASQILLAMKDAAGSLLEFFKNPNTHLYNDHQAQKLVTIRSQIRVREVNSCKLGGGHRVKRILINDNWEELSDISGSSMTYGQEYNYTTSLSKTNSTRISSGVAQYEPQVGAEENPFHQPVFYDVKFKGVPDEQFFHDDPIGEMLYPMASVGYSEVRVNNLSRENVSHNATGFVVQKFYTAKDFPIIADRTILNSYRDRTPNFSLQLLSNFKSHKDYYTGSQGFYVEMNDMHGKPMSQEVYAEGATTPKSFVKYEYKLNELPSASNRSKLDNLVTVVNGNGSIQNNRELGVVFDAYGYESEQNSVSNVCSVSPNVDVIALPLDRKSVV
jgi:hypothetical protein